MDIAVSISSLSFSYGSRRALQDVSLEVARGEIVAFLGPNGSGKTTLFRVLSTLVACQQGDVQLLGNDLRRERGKVRGHLGVVFQSPSLDRHLTVQENMRCQAAMYGVYGEKLHRRSRELLEQLGLADRARERVASLSGGLRRRVELAKGMIHHPDVLLLDEPSTGLDPAARNDLWRYLEQLRQSYPVTVLLTTHLLDEADRADRIAILDQGRMVAVGTPCELKASVGGNSVTIEADDPDSLAQDIRREFQMDVRIIDGRLRLQQGDAADWMGRLAKAFASRIRSITLAQPDLQDVFLTNTGRRFQDEESHS